jgi:hypothetical protein
MKYFMNYNFLHELYQEIYISLIERSLNVKVR